MNRNRKNRNNRNKEKRNYGYLLRVLWRFNKRYVLMLPVTACARMWRSLLFMVVPAWIIDAMLSENGESLNLAYYYAAVMGVCLLAGSVLSDRIEKYNERQTAECREWMVLLIQKKMVGSDYPLLEQPSFMDSCQKASSVYTLWQADLKRGTDALIRMIAAGLTMFASAGLLLSLNWVIALAVTAVVVLSSLCNTWAVKRMSALLMSFAPGIRRVNYFLEELQERKYAKEIRIYHMQKWISRQAEKILRNNLSQIMQAVNRQIHGESLSVTAGALQEAGTYLYIGWLALKGRITLGSVTMYVSAVHNFADSMKEAMACCMVLKEVENYYRSFASFVWEEEPVDKKELFTGKTTEVLTAPIRIEFDHVWFRYSSDTPWILQDVNFEISVGEKISLVGDNGAGKTTLVKLLLGLYNPQKGQIIINGKSLGEYEREVYWKMTGAVFQDYRSLAFTIHDNVVLGQKEKEPGALKKALEEGGLWEKVQSLPAKEKTFLGSMYYEGGVEISGGEQQKLAIAQTQYKDAPLMILDEPTANLSPMEEYRIFHRFYEMAKGRTVVFISHRMSSCRLCDRILVLKEGTLYEQGSHEELMEKDGLYAKMFRMQAKYYTRQKNDEITLETYVRT